MPQGRTFLRFNKGKALAFPNDRVEELKKFGWEEVPADKPAEKKTTGKTGEKSKP